MQTEQLLCKSDITDTEHSKISSSNEEEEAKGGGVVHLVERTGLVIERLRNLGLTHDAVARRCALEKDLMLFPVLGSSSLLVVVVQPDERHANRTASVLEWYDRHKSTQHLVQSKKDAAKNYDGVKSWGVFTKRVLVKNTLAVSCVKVRGGALPPGADAHAHKTMFTN